MNALYTHALRQTQSITSDLALLESTLRPTTPSLNGEGPSSRSLQGNGVDSAGLNGQIVASLAALQRTVDDYDNMAKRELVEANKGKAASRVERIRNDYQELRKQYDRLKQEQASLKTQADRSELLGASTSSAGGYGSSNYSTMQQRRIPNATSSLDATSESPYSLTPRSGTPNGSTGLGGGGKKSSIYTPRTNRALEENDFMNNTSTELDNFIAQGQAILGNLGSQKDVLKGTQRKLLSAANTLGLSRNTINFIERRGRGDMAVFIGGSIFTLVSFIAIIRYLG